MSTVDGVPDAGPVLIVGPVTRDHFADRIVPGGAVTYAGLAATALGIRAHVLVSGGEDADLSALAPHEVHRPPGAQTLTYEHHFIGRERQLRLLQHPGRILTPADIPSHWPPPRTLLLGPLLPDDIDVARFIEESPAEEIAFLGQGLQRQICDDGSVSLLDSPAPSLTTVLNPRVSLFVSADEVAPWPSGALERVIAHARRVVVTRGRDGADVYASTGDTHYPAPAADRVDPTGAGDVFATAFILTVRAGEHLAGRIASAFAAASVERRGPAPLPPWQEIRATLDASTSGDAPRPSAR